MGRGLLTYTDKNITFFTVGFVHVPRSINWRTYPGRINFELSVITLSDYRQRLMPHAPSVKHLMKVLDGPAVSSANFYAFDAHDVERCGDDLERSIRRLCCGWEPHAGAGLKRRRPLMRQGRKYLPEEAQRIYEAGCRISRRSIPKPTRRLSEPETDRRAFSIHSSWRKGYDRDGVERLQDPEHVSEEPREIPLCAERDVERRFRLHGPADLRRHCPRLTREKVVHIPKCVMQSGRGPYSDITGVTLEQFMKKTGVKVKVLHKIDTRFANEQLYRNGSLRNYVESYVRIP